MRTAASHRPAIVLSVLVAAVLVLAMSWFAADSAHVRAARLDPDAPAPDVNAVPRDAQLVATDAAPEVRRAVVDAVAPTTPAAPRAATANGVGSRFVQPPVGRLAVRAVDAVSGAPIRGPRVRAANATRIAEWPGATAYEETTLRLTPGDYELHVSAPGYEPVDSLYARVLADELARPDVIRMRPGSGRIVVRADGTGSAVGLRAELHGEGRLRCGDCTVSPCRHCGWAREHSRLALGPAGEIAFERLASGRYLVRFVDAGEREAGAPIAIDLAASEIRIVDVRVARARSVLVALADVDGTRLDGVWASRLASAPAELEEDSLVVVDTVEGCTWTCRFLAGEELVASGEFVPPLPSGVRAWSSMSIGCRIPGSKLRDDRVRRADESLRPRPVEPRIAPADLAPFVDKNGVVRIDDVPARAQVLEMSCGAFRARVAIDGDARGALAARVARDPAVDSEALTYAALESGRDR